MAGNVDRRSASRDSVSALGLLQLEMANVLCAVGSKRSQTSKSVVSQTQPGVCFALEKLATSREVGNHIADIRGTISLSFARAACRAR